ncbi:MAG: hypothetical protein Q4C98_09385 [Capnocytophaga sp.]|nr:hypothetical protein [Capnocytophaga sp.]
MHWNDSIQKLTLDYIAKEVFNDEGLTISYDSFKWNESEQKSKLLQSESSEYQKGKIIRKDLKNTDKIFRYLYDNEGDLLLFEVLKVQNEKELPVECIEYQYEDFDKKEVLQKHIFMDIFAFETKKVYSSIKCFQFIENKKVIMYEYKFTYDKNKLDIKEK